MGRIAEVAPWEKEALRWMIQNRYGHLMPGNEAEARDLLDAYLDQQNG
jgi:hypothetical protein